MQFDVNAIKENSSDRCILEVDLEYPNELHEMHNDFSLASEKLKINYDMSSNYCSDISSNYNIKIDNVNKLTPKLGN